MSFDLCASKSVLHFIERSARDTQKSREFTVALGSKSLGDIAADRIGGIIDLRPQFEISAQRRPFGKSEDFHSMLIRELPDDQLREMSRARHDLTGSKPAAPVLSATYGQCTQKLSRFERDRMAVPASHPSPPSHQPGAVSHPSHLSHPSPPSHQPGAVSHPSHPSHPSHLRCNYAFAISAYRNADAMIPLWKLPRSSFSSGAWAFSSGRPTPKSTLGIPSSR